MRQADFPTDSFTGEVEQRTRGADKNDPNPADDDQPDLNELFPSLEDGLTLLDIDGGRGVPVLHSLVLDHLLLNDGAAFWIDAEGYVTTTSLARLSPSRRLLDRIHIARGFTAYQHYATLCDLDSTPQRDSVDDCALLVAPALDARYRAEDSLSSTNAEMLQARAIAQLRSQSKADDAPVLVTRTTDDEFSAPIETAADHHLRCEITAMGPRFAGDEFEMLVYPVGDGAFYQTTIAYWRQVLATRSEQAGIDTAPSLAESTATENERLQGETAGGPTPDPLADTWVGPGAANR
jgi:hypothetical protein